MRAYPLRLKDELADAARAHADALGISFNALVAVALDAYLHGDPGPVKSAKRPAPTPKAKPATKAPASRGADRLDGMHPDPGNWRNFHSPDTWPHIDEWTPPAGITDPYEDPDLLDPDDVDRDRLKAFEDAYWAVHERPKGPWFDATEIPH